MATFFAVRRANATGPHALHVHTVVVREQLQTRVYRESTTFAALPHKRQSDDLFRLRSPAGGLG